MRAYSKEKAIYRIIDANVNRAKEGLRVIEEINRFILNNRKLSSGLKTLRHSLNHLILKSFPVNSLLIKERDSFKDVGRTLYAQELKRKNIEDIFYANLGRVKESVRVMEEFSKLVSPASSVSFKNIRYRVYELEKEVAFALARLRNRK